MKNREVIHGRIKGSRVTGEIKPTVDLISSTANPIETIFCVWHNSRHTNSLLPQDIIDVRVWYSIGDMIEIPNSAKEVLNEVIDNYPNYLDGHEFDTEIEEFEHIIIEVVKLAIKIDVQASEFISYEFQVSNGSVAWREQLVRNRQIHAWLQTSRTADHREFDAVRLEGIEQFGGDKAVEIYDETIETIRDAYVALSELGVPVEDVRLLPQSYVHKSAFGANLRVIIGLVKLRSSWIAQSSLWLPILGPIFKILRDDLGDEIVDSFAGQVSDATVSNGKVSNYKYDNEVLDRYYQNDPQPCDPLWLDNHQLMMPEHTDFEFYDYMKSMYLNIWGTEILDILGWDRDNPSKVGPYDRPYSWFEKHDRLDEVKHLTKELKGDLNE